MPSSPARATSRSAVSQPENDRILSAVFGPMPGITLRVAVEARKTACGVPKAASRVLNPTQPTSSTAFRAIQYFSDSSFMNHFHLFSRKSLPLDKGQSGGGRYIGCPKGVKFFHGWKTVAFFFAL